jgi:glucose-1-phosphate adenylyltransferase
MKNTLGIIVNNPSKKLYPLTEDRNPITLPIFARYRLVDFAMSNMVGSNITKIGVIASDKYRSLLDHVGTGQEWGLSRKSQALVILQGAKKFGDIDENNINLIDFEKNEMVFRRNTDNNILITTPNTVCRIDYIKVIDQHKQTGADITLVATKTVKTGEEKSCIFMDVGENNEIKSINLGSKEEHNRQYAGKLVIKREVLLSLMYLAPELGEYELLDLIMNNLDNFDVKCFTYEGYLRRITTIQEYFDTNMELLNPTISCKLFRGGQLIYTKIKDNHPTLYKPKCKVTSSCIASGGIIHGHIDKSVIFRHIYQEQDSKISNSILMEGCRVGMGTILDYVIADRNVTIGNNVVLKGTKESPVILKKEMNI